MKKQSTIFFATAVTDPTGGMAWQIPIAIPKLFGMVDGIYAIASHDTHKKTLQAMRDQGIDVKIAAPGPFNGNAISIKGAYDAGADTIFYIDFDRLLHWAWKYPAELAQTVALASTKDYVVCERRWEDYKKHHDALFETEQLPQRIIQIVMGEKDRHDYFGGAFGFSRRAAGILIKKGKCDWVEVWGYWPVLLHRNRIDPTYQVCRGLEWETPDRYRDEVKRVGGLKKWRIRHSSSAEWKRRTILAEGFVRKILK